jgi:hypothetical protein
MPTALAAARSVKVQHTVGAAGKTYMPCVVAQSYRRGRFNVVSPVAAGMGDAAALDLLLLACRRVGSDQGLHAHPLWPICAPAAIEAVLSGAWRFFQVRGPAPPVRLTLCVAPAVQTEHRVVVCQVASPVKEEWQLSMHGPSEWGRMRRDQPVLSAACGSWQQWRTASTAANKA